MNAYTNSYLSMSCFFSFCLNSLQLIKSSDFTGLKSQLEAVHGSGYMEDVLTCKDQYGWSLLHHVTNQDSSDIFNMVLQYVAGIYQSCTNANNVAKL